MKSFWPSQKLTLALLGSLVLASLGAAGPRKYKIRDEREAEEFMKELDVRYSHECNLETLARWDYMVDVADDDKEAAANKAAVRYLDFQGEAAVNASKFDYSGFESVDLYRRFRFLSKKGPGALSVEDLTKYKNHQSKMENIYSTATICDYHDPTKCGLALEPDIELIMASSEDWEELRYVWDQWREVSGKLMREDFIQFVELSNKAAALDGFHDTSDYWLNSYTVDEREAAAFQIANPLTQDQFQAMADQVWQKVSTELYKKLHSWVRWKMADVYPEHIDLTGPLPANILGNMWGQDWVNIAHRVMPFPEFPTYDVSESMVENGWDIQQIFESAEDFFESIGLFPMTQTFWDKSVVNQTEWGRVMMCHASAEDFCLGPEGDDYRIKMCTEVNMEDLVTVHHEMGHIEYFMAYKNLPHVFRDSANPGIHEAIGDLIALSVSTPSHLENVLHLMPGEGVRSGTSPASEYSDDEKRDLNFLMRMALEKIAFLPFGYLIDKFRWGVFEGSVPTDQMNAAWWQLREELQGVTPPGGSRGEEFFDAGAKFHVPANVPYIRYFVSFITQFQFHAHLCQVAGHQGPLHTCDIYNNRDAGSVLRNALERGFSEPWPVVLKDLGGSPDMDPQAIISYFDPLIQFLDNELAKAGQCIGWGEECVKSSVAASGSAGVLALEETDSSLTSEQSTSVTSTSEQSTSASATSEQSTSEQSTFESTTVQSTSEHSTSEQSTSASATSEQSTSEQSTSASTPSMQSTTVTAPPSSPVTELTTEPVTDNPASEDDAKKRLEEMDNAMTIHVQDSALADWNYETSMTEESKNASIEAWTDVKNNFHDFHEKTIDYFTYEGFSEGVKRQFELQRILEWPPSQGRPSKCEYYCGSAQFLVPLTDIVSHMVSTLGKKVCPVSNSECDAEKEGMGIYELEAKMTNVTESYDNLKYYWLEWRKVSKELLQDYKEYVELENKAAKLNGFNDTGRLWIDPYTDAEYTGDDFLSEVAALWNQTKPFYVNLRAYVFHKLKEKYGDDITTDDLIPAHILGDMYGENWESLYDLVAPHNDTHLPDISDVLDEKLGTVTDMTKQVEEFFNTMNLCITKADFLKFPSTLPRIKMCAAKTQDDFITLHHEMAHIEYMMAYSSNGKEVMPIVFRDGANPAFHEAVGSAIGLSARNPAYLQEVEDKLKQEKEFTIRSDALDEKLILNHLMKVALAKIPVLPYAYILDSWRWETFSDDTMTEYNKRWWELRIAEEGIAPPTKRFPKSEFDAGSKFDVAVSIPYIWRFVAQVLQFQIHHKLGEKCSCPDDINCRIWECPDAGSNLTTLMSRGRSVRWQTALNDFLGSEIGLNSEALENFFKPLDDFLTKYITDHEIDVTWDPDQINKYMDKEREEISATVPIVVGVVLACMVVVVIIAYFVGQKKQKKKLKAMESQVESGGHTNMEMQQSKKEESSDSEEEKEKETVDERF
ncbi:angiotensin-converting enzyme-like [Macrobrachium nipponense]|uniref:angiotensin-converting enzyme-like n=1 Tax=Macrobrachium nipponense TaxID=159736 RepID=UPI0030C813EE